MILSTSLQEKHCKNLYKQSFKKSRRSHVFVVSAHADDVT